MISRTEPPQDSSLECKTLIWESKHWHLLSASRSSIRSGWESGHAPLFPLHSDIPPCKGRAPEGSWPQGEGSASVQSGKPREAWSGTQQRHEPSGAAGPGALKRRLLSAGPSKPSTAPRGRGAGGVKDGRLTERPYPAIQGRPIPFGLPEHFLGK